MLFLRPPRTRNGAPHPFGFVLRICHPSTARDRRPIPLQFQDGRPPARFEFTGRRLLDQACQMRSFDGLAAEFLGKDDRRDRASHALGTADTIDRGIHFRRRIGLYRSDHVMGP